MIEIVKVVRVEPVDGWRLRVHFSNGAAGIHDFTSLVAETGPMVQPLKDDAFFRRVFVECGVLTWPNGFDLDAIALHDEMKAAGELHRDAAE